MTYWKTYPHIDVISENPYNYCIFRKKIFHQYLPRFLDPLEPNERKITVYGLRFSKTTFWNRLNTGFLEPTVATVLTACGIETTLSYKLIVIILAVATVLTACGIETEVHPHDCLPKYCVATVLTACGIETENKKGRK